VSLAVPLGCFDFLGGLVVGSLTSRRMCVQVGFEGVGDYALKVKCCCEEEATKAEDGGCASGFSLAQ
jgi:hypothetical protein